MDRTRVQVRWARVAAAGVLPPIAAQLSLVVGTMLGLAADSGTWGIAAWTALWTGTVAAGVALTAGAHAAAREGLVIGLVAALIGLAFYGPFGPGAAGLFALTVAASAAGGALGSVARGR